LTLLSVSSNLERLQNIEHVVQSLCSFLDSLYVPTIITMIGLVKQHIIVTCVHHANVKKLCCCDLFIGNILTRPFQRYITSPQLPRISVGKTPPKKLQWENNCVSFFTMFSTNALKEVGHMLIIGDD
jgi:hypothetical protein